MELTLKELHSGSCRTVVTLRLGSDAALEEFLDELVASNPNAARSLQTSMATVTSVEHYVNERKFKPVAKGIYEIKVPGVRLYCFKDQIDGVDPKLIIATNGGTKNKPREQKADIKRASQIRDRYLAAKNDPDTTLLYTPLSDED